VKETEHIVPPRKKARGELWHSYQLLLPSSATINDLQLFDTFIAAPPSSVDHFPRPQGLEKCQGKGARCVKGERLDFCHHQLEVFLMGSGVYDTA
jgi:hypothetical protein